MSEFLGIDGEFWTTENPGVHVRGEFTAKIGERAGATLDGGLTSGLVSGPRPTFIPGDMAGAMRAYAASSVARFRAISFQGRLDTGELVTLLDAPNYGGAGLAPHYKASMAVVGAHVSLDQPYTTVRFRLDQPYWLGHLIDGESSVVDDDRSTLSVEASADGNWLVYASSDPATLPQLEIRAMSSCLALAQLALFPDEDLVVRETHVRIDSDSAWLTVHGPAFCAEPSGPRLDTLLPRNELTVERFARWIELNDRFDGVAWAVARRLDVAVQLQVQLLTSLVEGFHRRLPYKQSWFPNETKAEKAALERVRKAAREAAAVQAEKEGLDRELMLERAKNALGHVGEKSFLERAEDVVKDVCAAVPEIAESVAKLPARLRDQRIDFAHQLPQDNTKDPLEDRARRWTVVSQVTPWLLRALLLLRVGVEPQVLREKYLENKRFAFYRVNVEQRVKELGWDFPAVESLAER
jgi:hypothetical protein